jgi:hypothetical protein
MTTGDIMFDDLSLYPRLNRIIGQIGISWYNIRGNHDLNYEARLEANLDATARCDRERSQYQGILSAGAESRLVASSHQADADISVCLLRMH